MRICSKAAARVIVAAFAAASVDAALSAQKARKCKESQFLPNHLAVLSTFNES